MKGNLGAIRRVLAAVIGLAGLGLATGAAAQQSAPYITYTTPSVTVRVHWSTQQEVEQRCGKDAAGCASPATTEKSYAEIWAQKPAGWDDWEAICYLGGVVLRIVDSGTARTNTAAAEVNAVPARQTALR